MTAGPTAALVLDEMFSPAIAVQLRRRHHDVVAVAAEPALRSMTDGELLAWSVTQRRRIVTENVKDFRVLIARHRIDSSDSPLVLYTSSRTFPRSRRSIGMLVAALDAWLRRPDLAERPHEDWLELAPPTRRR